MPTTRCADRLGELSRYARLEDLPPDTDALFDRAAGADLFCSRAWYQTVLASAMEPGEVGCLLVGGTGDAASVMLPMRLRKGERALTSLTTPYTCHYRPLCDPDATPSLLTSVFARLARHCGRWPVVRLDALDPADAWLSLFREGAAAAGLALRCFGHFGNWHEAVTGEDWASYLAARPGQLRETIRRRLARGARAGGRFELVTGGAGLEAGIAAYETVYARSWKPVEPFPLFNAALMRATAALGVLRLGLYWRGDQPVAAQFWVNDSGCARVLKLAHDEAAKADSPGTVLTARMLQRLIDEERVTEIDFGRGDDPYKQMWARARRQRIGLVLANPRHPLGLAFLARHAVGRMRRAVGS
jgi:hypothetical protein